MQQVNIHDAKTHLFRLIEQAVHGEPFVIAKSGKPMVTVSAYTPPPPTSFFTKSRRARYALRDLPFENPLI
jgi:prevent-host-death family protein